MANAGRSLRDVVSQELNDRRSELNEATAAAEKELEAARRKRQASGKRPTRCRSCSLWLPRLRSRRSWGWTFSCLG
jgi:hypothetical protein